jgi:hypothetical protein
MKLGPALLLVTLSLGALIQVGPASAGTAFSNLGTLTYEADPGETNRVYLVEGPINKWRVVDTSATVTAGTDCTAVNVHEALCGGFYGADIRVSLGDLDDFVSVSGDPTIRTARSRTGTPSRISTEALGRTSSRAAIAGTSSTAGRDRTSSGRALRSSTLLLTPPGRIRSL